MGKVAIIGVGQSAFVRGYPGSIRELAFDESSYRSLVHSWFQHSYLYELLKQLTIKLCIGVAVSKA